MATDIRALPAYFNTDADFRAWGSGLAAQFTAMGLVKTSDTGQIDWTTVVKPSVVSTMQGYEIWRFADALQATKPVFIKIEYGSAAAIDRPGMAWTVGTGTNGAGTINGQVGARHTNTIASASKTAGATLNSYCSGSTSRLSLMTNFDPATVTFFINMMIERPKTPAGADQGDCIVTAGCSSASSGRYQLIPYLAAVPGSVTNMPSLANTATLYGGVPIIGTDMALSPAIIFIGKVLVASWLVYQATDIGAMGSFTCTHLGAVRTFMPFGIFGCYSPPLTQTSSTAMALAMLWE